MKIHSVTAPLILAATLAVPASVWAGENSLADRRSNDNSWITRDAEPLSEDRLNGDRSGMDLNTLPPPAAGMPKAGQHLDRMDKTRDDVMTDGRHGMRMDRMDEAGDEMMTDGRHGMRMGRMPGETAHQYKMRAFGPNN